MSSKTKGIIGSIFIHGIFLVALILFGFSTPLPLPGEEGILINFGTDDQGMGLREPQKTDKPASTPTQTPVTEKIEEVPITQDFEEAPSIDEPKAKPDIKPKEEKPEDKPKEKEKEAEEKPREIDQRILFPGKKANGDSSGEGDATVKGNQGDVEGSVDSQNREGGTTSGGEGISFSLGNRGAQSLPQPEYPRQKSGRIVVEVTVNRNGYVTKARGGIRGSTSTDTELIKAAEKAALRARFNINREAPASQMGTITYIFKLQ